MRSLRPLLIFVLLIHAASSPAQLNRKTLDIDPLIDSNVPVFSILSQSEDAVKIEIRLPSLIEEELRIEDDLFQVLAIPGGEIIGEPGRPGLPSITRLVTIPDEAGVSFIETNHMVKALDGYRILPVQPPGSDDFVLDQTFYDQSLRDDQPVVTIGDPLLFHGLRVVPLTFSPVSFNPSTGELTITSSIVVDLDLSGVDLRNTPGRTRSIIPESFHNMYRQSVINYGEIMDRDDVQVGPGTYLLIYASPTGVLSRLQPLIDWRRQQGYNVLTVSTSTTGTGTSSIKSYIQNIYNTVDPPLEFVALAGDANGSYPVACWFESYSGYGGEGDHNYSTLEGGDILADVHIGRISFRDLTTLETMVDKIITYETNPPTGADPGWFTRAALTGDPGSSGITTIYVNRWLKTQLIREGYTQIDTIFSSPWVSQMTSKISGGISVFTYRGYLNMSGLTWENIRDTTNGYKLPFAVIPTCGSGSFSDDYTAESEAFLRSSTGGGIGAVGTATWGTHTRYNNCYFTGVWDGVLNTYDYRLGPGHTHGKLNLYLNYRYDGNFSGHVVDIWSTWNNLMGDPATEMWTGFPSNMTVDYPATLPVEANSLPVTVTSASVPLADALVTLFKDGEIQVSAYTDISGQVSLPISSVTSGTAQITVTKHNHIPHRGSLSFGAIGSFAGYYDSTIDDDLSGDSSGNGDGILNPAEDIELAVALRNFGSSSAPGVSATLSTTDSYVTITDGEETFGDIGPGATVWSAEDFDFSLAPLTPDSHVVNLNLEATSLASQWNSLITFTVQSAAFDVETFTWGGHGSGPDPGESGTLSLQIRNVGSISATNVTAELTTDSPWIEITDSNGGFGTMAVGVASENTADPFSLTVAGDCVNGHQAQFTLILSFNGSAQSKTEFKYQVGLQSSVDPTGPDEYGYYAFDNTDIGYAYAPTYSWIEIDPNQGGSGVDVGLTDFGWEQDDIKIMNLPFTFRFYGQDYDQISICSNGYITMGPSYLTLYANTTLPSAGSPDALICPMWDNLYQTGTNRVYYLNDTANHRYIIQWSRVRNDYSESTQNFEMILYDPSYYPTASGDGEILFQYATVNNTDSRDGYVTVGIQNQDHSDGLLYTYWNRYETGAASLTTGRAIRILPIGALILGSLEGDITNSSNGGTPAAGVAVRILETSQIFSSESDGHFSGAVQEGLYTVRAEHYSFDLITETDVEILEDQTTVLNFALTDILGPSITNTTVLPYTNDTTGPYVVQTTLGDFSAITAGNLYYTVNGGGQVEVPLTIVDAPTGLYQGEIPGQALNSEISYWIEAEDIASNQSRDPEGVDTYDFRILSTATILDDDVEDDEGWTIGDTGDDASAGVWVRVDPNGVWEGGTEVQPEDDATASPGVMCFITGNDPPGSTQGTNDVDGGKTTLLTPWFDLSSFYQVHLTYRRWYTNDTGNAPGQDYWVVQATDDGTTWATLENTNASDRSWALKSFTLDDYIDLTGTVRIRFIASDEGSGSVVEAGVDEFHLSGYLDLSLSGMISGGELVLNWTAIPGVSYYWIHGADNAHHFTPQAGNKLATIPAGTTTWSSALGIGGPAHNWTYVVIGVDASEGELARTNRYGEFDYTTLR